MQTTKYYLAQPKGTETRTGEPIATYNDKEYILIMGRKNIADLLPQYRKNTNTQILKVLESANDRMVIQLITSIKSYHEYERIKAKRDNEREEIIEKFKNVLLEEEGIRNGLQLVLLGSRERRKYIGIVSTILGETIRHDISDIYMGEICKKLGRNIQKDIIDILYQSDMQINSTIDLIKVGPHLFEKIFGLKIINKALQTSGSVSIQKLIKFGRYLGRSFEEEIKEKLKIQTAIQFRKCTRNFLDTHKEILGILIGKTLNYVTLADRKEICIMLGRDTAEEIGEYITTHNDNNMYATIKDLGLHKKCVYLFYTYRLQMGCYLGYDVIERIEKEFAIFVCTKYKIKGKEDYDRKITEKECKNISLQRIGLILGHTTPQNIGEEQKTNLRQKIAPYIENHTE